MKLRNLFVSLIVLSCLLLSFPVSSALGENTAKPFALVELYTSQGCSSCPSADKLLRELLKDAQEKNLRVYPMSFHVDYWNYLGWKDPFSAESATKRQQNYARAFGNSQVYTPQIVVNGIDEFNGSDKSRLEKAVAGALRLQASVQLQISAETSEQTRGYTVSYELGNAPSNSLLYLALVDSPKQTYVSAGENKGSTLSHANVVRSLKSVSIEKQTSGQVTLPFPRVAARNRSFIYAFVQDKKTMRIIAADGVSLAVE